MQQKTTNVEKEYTSAFALDNAKLSRMINILSERFNDLQLQVNANYIVHLKNEKKIEIASLEQLLKLDNTVKNPIQSLEIQATGSSAQHEVTSHITYSDGERDNINVSVESNDANFALKLFAELEEQVERTFLNNWIYRLLGDRYVKAIAPVIFAMLLSLVMFFFIPTPTTSYLETQKANELLLQAEQATTTDKKIDFLFNYQVQELKLQSEKNSINNFNLQNLFTVKTLFIALPIILVVGCVFYAIAFCYPRAVFDWGDYKERYAHLISVRNTLWIVVILSMILGVLTNLFVMGVSGFINIG